MLQSLLCHGSPSQVVNGSWHCTDELWDISDASVVGVEVTRVTRVTRKGRQSRSATASLLIKNYQCMKEEI